LFTVFTMSDQRNHILGCACDLYLEDGLEGFSMRKLARQVGVTAPALYRYYEGREEVVLDVVREAYREFSSFLYQALEGRTPEERMRRAGEGYLQFALQHPRWYQMVFLLPDQLGIESFPEDIEDQGAAVHQFWVDRLRECMDAGLLKEDDPDEVAMTLWAHSHGFISLYQNGHLGVDEEGFQAALAASSTRMWCGMATESFARQIRERCCGETADGEPTPAAEQQREWEQGVA